MISQVSLRSTPWLRVLVAIVWCGGVPNEIAAQEFTPPGGGDQTDKRRTRFGLYGFSTRLGWELEGDNHAILSVGLDLGHLGSERFRFRPSAEIGFAGTVDTYVVNTELIYRFTPDTEVAVPYVGVGLALQGQDNCRIVSDCPAVWLQFALGFELQTRGNLNWMVEYHGEDALRRHRLFFGLTTRRGS